MYSSTAVLNAALSVWQNDVGELLSNGFELGLRLGTREGVRLDWKANVRIEDDDVRHCSLSTKKTKSTQSRCFTHGIHFGRCRAGGAARAGHNGCAHRGRGLEGECLHRRMTA